MTGASVGIASGADARGRARVIAVTSGKGGVGKSSLALNMAIELGRKGQRVCLLDADTNLANITILAGLAANHHLQQYLAGDVELEDLLISGPQGIEILSSASGLADLVNPPQAVHDKYRRLVHRLEQGYDYLLIDTAAGLEQSVLTFLALAAELVLVITAEPTSLTDAFSLLKVLRPFNEDVSVQVVVNQVQDFPQARDAYRRFSSAVQKYIGIRTRPLGYVYKDARVPRAVMMQKPFAEHALDSSAYRCLRHMVGVLRQFHEGKIRPGLMDLQLRAVDPLEAVVVSESARHDDRALSRQRILDMIADLPRAEAVDVLREASRALERASLEPPAVCPTDDALRHAINYARRLP